MREYLKRVRKPNLDISLKLKIVNTLGIILLGACLGLAQKWLDAKAINELPQIFEVLDIGNFLGEMSIWILLGSIISVYSSTPLRAGLNVSLFFISMLLTYYWYSYFILGFLPLDYMMMWMLLALISFVLSYICWYAKGSGMIGTVLSAIILGALLAQWIWFFQGIRLISFLGCITWMIGVVILYRKAKETILVLGLSLVVAILYQYFLPHL